MTPCHYCRRAITASNQSGIDRVDNSIGYVSGNVVPCCWECNGMKREFDGEAFISMAKRVHARAHLLENDIPEMARCIRVITRRQVPAGSSTDEDEMEEEEAMISL